MRYIIARFFQGIITIFGVSVITFVLPALYFKPYGLARQVLGPRANRFDINLWINQQGLNGGLVERYWNWLWKLLHGNLGISYTASHGVNLVSVNTVLGPTVWRSVWLTFIPTVASVCIAVPIGLSQAFRRNRPYDHVMTTFIFFVYSMPVVLVCLLLQYYIGVDVLHTPTINSYAQQVSAGGFPKYMLLHFNQFVLPFIAIIAVSLGGYTRFMRGSALDTLVQDHVRTARAKGARPRRVLFRHVMRPSLIPMITLVGLTIPAIISGALIVEQVFNYPGMGQLAVQSTEGGDFATVLAITIFTAILTVAGNLFADMMIAVADPRVRLGASR